jgi:hypothetical protein
MGGIYLVDSQHFIDMRLVDRYGYPAIRSDVQGQLNVPSQPDSICETNSAVNLDAVTTASALGARRINDRAQYSFIRMGTHKGSCLTLLVISG